MDYYTIVWPTQRIHLSSPFLCFFPIGLLHSPVHLLVSARSIPVSRARCWTLGSVPELSSMSDEWTNFIATHCLLSGDIFVKGLDEGFSHSSLFSGFLSAVWLSWLTDRTMDSCHPGCIAYRRSFRSHIFLFSHNCNGIRKYLSLMSVTNCVVTVGQLYAKPGNSLAIKWILQ